MNEIIVVIKLFLCFPVKPLRYVIFVRFVDDVHICIMSSIDNRRDHLPVGRILSVTHQGATLLLHYVS